MVKVGKVLHLLSWSDNTKVCQLLLETTLGEKTLHHVGSIQTVHTVGAEASPLKGVSLGGAKVAKAINMLGDTVEEKGETIPATGTTLMMKVK